MNILITGLNGFIGQNLYNLYRDKFGITGYCRKKKEINHPDVIIHLAGKAHDLRNVSNPEEYYISNTDLTKEIYDQFLESDCEVFIMMSSIKVLGEKFDKIITENIKPNPKTHYGKSKLLAEGYIQSRKIPKNKRFFILRPSIVYGSGNKGNLIQLFNIFSKINFWPLGLYKNNRSMCSVINLAFIIEEIIKNSSIKSGIYNVCDDDTISTNELIKIISEALNKKITILNIPKSIIKFISLIGDKLFLPINNDRLQKLTQNFIMSNSKIKNEIKKPLPVKINKGLLKFFYNLK